MASGRFLSVSVAEDDRLNNLSMVAELIYLKTVPHLDRDGMISGKPGLLYSKVCPLREELFGQTQHIIDEWIEIGLVVRFMTDAGPVLFFPGFSKNNNLPHYDRERPSRFPCPPGYTRGPKGLIAIDAESASTPPKKNPPVTPSAKPDPVQLQDEVQDEVQEFVPILGTEDKDQDQDKEEKKKSAALTPAPAPTPNPACAIYREIMHLNPSAHQAEVIAKTVTDLELWRLCVGGWNEAGYKPTNIRGILDWYAAGGPPIYERPSRAELQRVNGIGPPRNVSKIRGNLNAADSLGRKLPQ